MVIKRKPDQEDIMESASQDFDFEEMPEKRHKFPYVTALLVVLAAFSLYGALMVSTKNNYTISDGSSTTIISSASADLNQVLLEAGYSVGEGDTVSSSSLVSGTAITITRAEAEQPAEEAAAEEPVKEEIKNETDSAVIFSSADEPVYEEAEASDITETEIGSVREEEIRVDTPEEETAEETYLAEESEEYEEAEPGETWDYEPETAPEPAPEPEPYYEPDPEPDYSSANTITASDGTVYTYSKVITVEATAYCGGGTTATGTPARYGAIAVDPDVIPYGTEMYIVTEDGSWVYGYATAEDCGGAINGYIVDLYFDSYSTCIQFGRRNCTVYILD